MSAKVKRTFPALVPANFTPASVPLAQLPDSDAVIATLWSSAYPVLHMRNTRAKFYFVQDNEPQFYPAGAASGLVEESYRFGLPGHRQHAGTGGGLRLLRQPRGVVRSGGGPESVPPRTTSRATRRHPCGSSSTPAPAASRNSFGLGIASLAQLKRDYGDRVEIVCAGEDWNPGQFGLHGKIRNLGVLNSLDEVATLYRSCDIGLVFMQTKHPSYQPFEFMASGMATVTNVNPATAWLLRDGENCLLTPPLPTPTAERLGRLVSDPALRARIAAAGLEQVSRYRWDEQIEAVWSKICLADGIKTWKRSSTTAHV